MRRETNKERLIVFMEQLGKRVRGSGRIYITGGACSVWLGWREMTIDIDIKAEPEPGGLFEGIAEIKDSLQVNIELASPDQFIPELPGWRERSPFIQKSGNMDFFHYDFYAQALSKLERGHTRDLLDIQSMKAEQLILPEKLLGYFEQIEPDLIRFPAIERNRFRQRVLEFCGGTDNLKS